ncbi:helix-turn-helix transcriptional regulator [Aquincola sp. MAHUQ-54]|uniref:Helix-turn-helix transcriptional regulator n=1 Tax=Aquincola agrisoli TaxID=3119538 RepID=A0AAW9QED4_9BURK
MTESLLAAPHGRNAFLAAVDALLLVNSVEELVDCLRREVQALLPYGCVVGGLGRVSGGRVVPEMLVTDDFPAEYLETIRGPSASLRSAVLARWLRSGKPVCMELGRSNAELSAQELHLARRFEFRNVLAHGHFMPREGLLTYFSFHRFAASVTEDQRRLVARLMPHLHCAATRVRMQGLPDREAPAALTSRQQDIVEWLLLGKTNWEIAQIVGTSVANIKYHVSRLMRMHQVSSRASLVFSLVTHPADPARTRPGCATAAAGVSTR